LPCLRFSVFLVFFLSFLCFFCHSRAGGNPSWILIKYLDSRLRGNDKQEAGRTSNWREGQATGGKDKQRAGRAESFRSRFCRERDG
jgi:hypothetical protein